MTTLGIAILAAGKGTRLKIDRPKPLCPALGRTLVDYVVTESLRFASEAGIVATLTAVVGYKREDVQAHLEKAFPGLCSYAWQREQRGTADALRAYFDECPANWKQTYTFITCADTPLIEASTFQLLWDVMQKNPSLKACAGTFEAPVPTGYGRVIREAKGFKIVEEKDATPEERKITEVNSGFYLVKTDFLRERLGAIGNKNKSGEFYLTDIFSVDSEVEALKCPNAEVFLGVNTLEQLEQCTQVLRKRKLSALMNSGVIMFDASSTYVDWDVEVAAETTLYPGVNLLGKTKIGRGVVIETGAVIKDSEVQDRTEILAYSHLEKAFVRTGAHVGPFARLRPESDIGPSAKIGNFVEVKKAKLASGVKVSHLSYVGDAEIGEETNIGCGFITCNYDGVNKHRTKIGKNVFVGSDVQVIAPLEIGDDAFVAAGSTVSKDVPTGAFGIARSPFAVKEGMAHRFLKKKKP